MTEEPAIESPCIRECLVDPVTGYCTGCFRTLREISCWATYTPVEQQHVMAQIEARCALERGRGDRNSRSPMQLQNERAGVTIKVSAEDVKRTLARG